MLSARESSASARVCSASACPSPPTPHPPPPAAADAGSHSAARGPASARRPPACRRPRPPPAATNLRSTLPYTPPPTLPPRLTPWSCPAGAGARRARASWVSCANSWKRMSDCRLDFSASMMSGWYWSASFDAAAVSSSACAARGPPSAPSPRRAAARTRGDAPRAGAAGRRMAALGHPWDAPDSDKEQDPSPPMLSRAGWSGGFRPGRRVRVTPSRPASSFARSLGFVPLAGAGAGAAGAAAHLGLLGRDGRQVLLRCLQLGAERHGRRRVRVLRVGRAALRFGGGGGAVPRGAGSPGRRGKAWVGKRGATRESRRLAPRAKSLESSRIRGGAEKTAREAGATAGGRTFPWFVAMPYWVATCRYPGSLHP